MNLVTLHELIYSFCWLLNTLGIFQINSLNILIMISILMLTVTKVNKTTFGNNKI